MSALPRRAAGTDWSVYMVRCRDGSLYTGIAKDVAARVKTHNAGKGSAYARSRLPVKLVHEENRLTQSQALVREAAIKALAKRGKEEIVSSGATRGRVEMKKKTTFFSARADLKRFQTGAKAKILKSFFKTGPGQYGEGDRFLGVTVPNTRRVAHRHRDLPLPEVGQLLKSSWHEERLLGLLILVDRFEKTDLRERERLFKFYCRHMSRVNNWDLVDLSAPAIVGGYLLDRNASLLDRWARSPRLWERRIAIVATHAFIRANRFQETFRIAELLLRDPEDLIHKAVGWMLREIGKRDRPALEAFLLRHAPRMPRTMLRYAIERFDEPVRREFMSLPRVDSL